MTGAGQGLREASGGTSDAVVAGVLLVLASQSVKGIAAVTDRPDVLENMPASKPSLATRRLTGSY